MNSYVMTKSYHAKLSTLTGPLERNNSSSDLARGNYPGVPEHLRKRMLRNPSYCFLLSKVSVNIMKFELDSLVAHGGCYYEIFDRLGFESE
jgi:hypothetical protein